MKFSIPDIVCAYDAFYFRIHKKELSSEHRLPEGFTVTYHAGAMHTKPNTVESVRAALSKNAAVVEFDVSFRPDGTPVIIHDPAPKMNEGVLLEDALRAVAEHPFCKINLDIKSTKNLGAVDELVKKHGLWERVFYTGVFEDWVDTVKRNSDIPYYLNHNLSDDEANNFGLWNSLAERTKELGATGINSNYKNASSDFCDFMHSAGLLVSLWTVNKPHDMVRVLSYSPDNITTKRPALLLKLL
ncbi:MAG: glycerophosphodiester phosphodiesterase [Clostridia bacterium]|nr:glycerophosphodiester phosphodiesterase [Clostridia bacterium]